MYYQMRGVHIPIYINYNQNSPYIYDLNSRFVLSDCLLKPKQWYSEKPISALDMRTVDRVTWCNCPFCPAYGQSIQLMFFPIKRYQMSNQDRNLYEIFRAK